MDNGLDYLFNDVTVELSQEEKTKIINESFCLARTKGNALHDALKAKHTSHVNRILIVNPVSYDYISTILTKSLGYYESIVCPKYVVHVIEISFCDDIYLTCDYTDKYKLLIKLGE